MFYTIHRAIKFLCICALLGVAFKMYQHRAALQPAFIWYDVWDNGGFRSPEPTTASGRVEQVINSQTFVVDCRSNKQRIRFNFRLQGLQEPSKGTLEGVEREKKAREALAGLIDKQWVHLEITYQNGNNLGGVAFVGGTNVNAELVRQRNASTSKALVKGLSKESQYSLLWANRHRVN
jgi:endonuclease YncB( thermonuclease family)